MESTLRARIDFDKSLVVGDEVEVRWTCGSFGHYRGTGTIAKINAASIRVRLSAPVASGSDFGSGWPAGREIVVPREFNWISGTPNSKWAVFNGVFPK